MKREGVRVRRRGITETLVPVREEGGLGALAGLRTPWGAVLGSNGFLPQCICCFALCGAEGTLGARAVRTVGGAGAAWHDPVR